MNSLTLIYEIQFNPILIHLPLTTIIGILLSISAIATVIFWLSFIITSKWVEIIRWIIVGISGATIIGNSISQIKDKPSDKPSDKDKESNNGDKGKESNTGDKESNTGDKGKGSNNSDQSNVDKNKSNTNNAKSSFFLSILLAYLDIDISDNSSRIVALANGVFMLALISFCCFVNVFFYIVVYILIQHTSYETKYPRLKWLINYYKNTSLLFIAIQAAIGFIALLFLIILSLKAILN